jgi:hypothetical protein
VANTLNAFRCGDVGFIDWLDLVTMGYFFRVLQRAASYRVVFGPTIDADKEITLALHGTRESKKQDRRSKTKEQ